MVWSDESLLMVNKDKGKRGFSGLRKSNTLQSVGINQTNPGQVKIALATASFSIIPNTIFKDSQIHHYSKKWQVPQVKTQQLEALDSTLVYAIPETLASYNPSFEVGHILQLLAERQDMYEMENDADRIFCYVHDRRFFLLVYKGNKLVDYNYWGKNSAHEWLYFILLACHNHNLDPKDAAVYFSGSIEDSEEVEAFIKTHVPGFQRAFIQFPEDHLLDISVKEAQTCSELFYLHLCA